MAAKCSHGVVALQCFYTFFPEQTAYSFKCTKLCFFSALYDSLISVIWVFSYGRLIRLILRQARIRYSKTIQKLSVRYDKHYIYHIYVK